MLQLWRARGFAQEALKAVSQSSPEPPLTSLSLASLPSTENVPEPSPFWEKKMFKRFEKMDFNKDGWVSEGDFQAQMDRLMTEEKYSPEATKQLTALFHKHYKRVWSFGEDFSARAVSRRQFIRGYSHILKNPAARRELNQTIAYLLGSTFDAFDAASGGSGKGTMTKEQFLDYQACWNLSHEEAADLFHCVSGKGADAITRDAYLMAAWDFYFGMEESKVGGHKFWGKLRETRPNLTF